MDGRRYAEGLEEDLLKNLNLLLLLEKVPHRFITLFTYFYLQNMSFAYHKIMKP